MSSAAAKAEARRKAILSRGSDRLSKLTSSARGEDNPVYMNNEPQTRRTGNTETFLGDETIMPTTAHAGPNPALEPQNIPVDSSSAWSQDEQREFLRALMAAPELTGGSPTSTQTGPALDFTASAADDPMAAMMSALTQLTGQMPAGLGNAGGIPPGLKQMSDTPRAKTFAAKILPLLHLLATWALLAFFALYKEPEAYSSALHVDGNDGILQRWAELAWRNTKGGFGVQPVSFFWAFVSLQLALHSVQIFTKTDPLQPHMLIALALPYLPSRLRSIITNALTYLKMAGTLLDDLAGLVLGVGILVWVAAWTSGR